MRVSQVVVFLILLFALTTKADAQTDSLTFGQKLLKENQTAKARKLLKGGKGKQKLQAKKDSIKNPVPTDSLRLKFQKAASPVTTWQSKFRSDIDSTMRVVNSPVNKATSKVTSVKQKVTSKTDSLFNKINQPIDKVSQTVTHTYDSITNKANEAIRVVTDPLGVDGATIPGLSKETTGAIPGLPTKDLNIETSIGKELQTKIDKPSLNEIPGMEKVNEVKDLKNMPKEKLESIKSAEQIQNATTKVQALDSKLDRVEKLEDDAKNIAQGNLDEVKQAPEEIEKQLVARAGVTEGQQYMSKVEQQRAMLEKYKDRKLVEQELRSKSLNVATEKVNHDLPQIDKADDKLKKTRKKFSSFQSVKDLPKRPENEMKGKSFSQRFIPSITLHFFAYDGKKIFDVAGQAGYRLSGRITTGVGGIYRIAINKSYKYYMSDFGMYGTRAFGQIRIAKGFLAHLDFETLWLDKKYYPTIENEASLRVMQSNVGIGKSFAISKRIRGVATGLYRIEYDGTLPGQPKFTMRVGFELHPKKKRYENKKS